MAKMQLRQYSLVFCSTTLLLVLTGRESIAFSISGTQTGSQLSFTPKDAFGNEINTTGTVKTYDLSPLPPLDVTTSNNFRTALQNPNSDFSDWTFNKGRNLNGSFNVLQYFPCNRQTPCGVSQNPDSANVIKTDGIGALLDLQYIAGNDDPKFGETEQTNKLHWIQQLSFTITDPSDTSSSQTQNLIDIGAQSGEVRLPYYDASYSLFPDSPSLDRFIDRPYRGDSEFNYTFLANLYLVEETAPKTVTVYNGISWGWQSTYTPPSSGGGGGGSSGGGSGGGGIFSSFRARELPISDIDSGDTSQLTQPAPESKSTLASAIGSWFKSLGSQNKNTGECAARW